ncbi:MAG: tripartite tricarboxylate transporter substrate binding protein [Burkholderiales bacterium]
MRTTFKSGYSALLVAGCVAHGVAMGQSYPNKPVQIVVPFAPGGSIDITFRTIGPGLGDRLGQPIIVMNRPGGAATIGMGVVAKSAPDGYTFGAASLAFAANPPFLGDKMPFDTEKDLVPVTQVAKSALAFLVNAEVPARSISEFIALAKAKPGVLNYGSVGVASSGHLVTSLFEQLAGVSMTHVPYTQGPLPALVANQIQLQLGPIPSSMPFIKAGKLFALGVSSLTADPSLPGVPPVANTVPGFEASEWPGLVAPAGTPAAIISRVQQEVARVIADPEVRKRLTDIGSVPVGSTPAEFGSFIKKELATWAKVATVILADPKNR